MEFCRDPFMSNRELLSRLKMKRILYVATKNADYLRLTQEIRLLRQNGNDVTVVTSPEKSYVKRLLSVYPRLLKARTADFDVIFIGFAPQLVLPLLGWRFRRNTVVIDFFISLYDTFCCDRRKFKPHSLPGRLLHWLDRHTLARADYAVCDTRAHGRYFCREFHYSPKKMSVLYLEAEPSIYYPRETPPHEKFTVLYFGSILPLQGVDVLLEAVELLQDEPGLEFVIIGPLGKHRRTGQRITRYIDWLPQEKLAQEISAADLCLGGHFSGSIAKARRTIAGKTYIFRAMQKPVILGDNAANRELFSPLEGQIYYTKMGDPAALAQTIRRAKADWMKQKAHRRGI